MSTPTRRGRQTIGSLDKRTAVLERLPACFAKKLEDMSTEIAALRTQMAENNAVSNLALSKVVTFSERAEPLLDFGERMNVHGLESFAGACSVVGSGVAWGASKVLWVAKRAALSAAFLAAVLLAAYAFFGYTPPDRLVTWVKVLRGLF